MHTDNVTVAAVQYCPSPKDVSRNLDVAQQMAYEAAIGKAVVVVLPELCMSGRNLESSIDAMECAQDRCGSQTAVMVQVAARTGCHIVFGYVELCDGVLYNSAAVVGPYGLEANVRKHNLWGNDHFWASPSNDLMPIVTTLAGRLGVLIGNDAMNNHRLTYDLYVPENRFYYKGSVDVIATLTNWNEGFVQPVNYPSDEWIRLAESTKACIIVSNTVFPEAVDSLHGGSCVIDKGMHVQKDGSSFLEPTIVYGRIAQ